jgi:hypothetical protein
MIKSKPIHKDSINVDNVEVSIVLHVTQQFLLNIVRIRNKKSVRVQNNFTRRLYIGILGWSLQNNVKIAFSKWNDKLN